MQRQPGTNTVEVVDNVKTLLPVFRTEIPPSVELTIAFDASESIKASISDVEVHPDPDGLPGGDGDFHLPAQPVGDQLIPGVAVPLSIIGTFAAMYLLGYSLNNLSLMALTLSVGFVVDDAIVMLENIVRYMEMGKAAWRRRCWRPREIGFTIISMTISLVAVFIPVLFHGRHRGTAAARIFGDHHRRHPDLGLCFAEPDADAGQPVSAL